MAEKLFNREQEDFIRQNVKGRMAKELAQLVNEKFGLSITIEQIRSYKKNRRLPSGLDNRFKKGIVPANKGKKMPGTGHSETWFRKGQRPHNWVPIGSERINDGYVHIKIAEGKNHRNWRAKHVIIWEKHNGPIPKGHAVIFGDGDRRNFDINNLIRVTKKQLLILNREGLITNNADLTRSSVLVADLISKIVEKKR